MCHDADSRPPVPPLAGAAVDGLPLVLAAADGNRFAAFRAGARSPTGAGILVLPDVRGLFPFYEELALRFAESGVDAIAIDYYGRTAGAARRGPDFDPSEHTPRTTWTGLRVDAAAAAAHLRSERGVDRLFSVGFCFGGRTSLALGTVPDLGLEGVIGFYGPPVGPGRNDTPAPADVADRFTARVLGLYGGADPGIPDDHVKRFRSALAAAGVEHRIVVYPGAPHSFFDRKQADFGAQSEAAWREALTFIRGGAASSTR
jgi:carboxymethylenebutenolidase